MDIDPDSDYETEERKGSSSHRKHCPACECRAGGSDPPLAGFRKYRAESWHTEYMANSKNPQAASKKI